MNLFKISIKNIVKCKKDYSVYFLTLIIGVTIFYMFNSIGSQSVMQGLSSTQNYIVSLMVTLIEGMSVGVAFILGLLMVYANNFLIKRRKKEFGVYMLLGMSKKKVSKILIGETAIAGVFSLGIGLLLGIFGSQFLSIIVGKLFAVDLSAYTFTISASALIKTVINYAIIFLIVLIFNTVTVSKYKLIDLLGAEGKAEKRILKSNKLSVIIFAIFAGLLICNYIRVGLYGEMLSRNELLAHILCGIVSTFMIFWSLSGFLFDILKKCKRMYARGLNSFVIRQFCHNINSSSFSLALISLLLFLAIGAFSTGFSMSNYFYKRLGNAAPVDICLSMNGERPTDLLAKENIPVDEWASTYYELPVYNASYITLGSSVGAALDQAKERFPYANWQAPENVMKLSDFNTLERAYGREELKLDSDEYAIISDFDLLNPFINEAIKQGNEIVVGDTLLTSGYDESLDEFVIMTGLNAQLGTIVLPDEFIDNPENGFEETSYVFVADYIQTEKAAKYPVDEMIKTAMASYIEYGPGNEAPVMVLSTKNQIEDSAIGTSVLVVFLVLYIGIVFVLASSAIIALKILSDSIDSIKKFEILSRIGADERMKKKALFTQVLCNFLLPLVFAVIDSVFGIMFVQGTLDSLGINKMGAGISVTVIIMLVAYGGYFVTTYFGCKRIVNVD